MYEYEYEGFPYNFEIRFIVWFPYWWLIFQQVCKHNINDFMNQTWGLVYASSSKFPPDSEDLLFAFNAKDTLSPFSPVFLFRCLFHSPSFLEAIWLLRRVVEYPSVPGKAFGPCASASLTGPRARRCRLYSPLIGLEIILFHRWMAKPQQSGERVTALSHRVSWVLMLLQQLLGSVLLTSSHLQWGKQEVKNS